MEYDMHVHIERNNLIITESDDTPQEHIRSIPLAAVAAYSELLGYSDPSETVDAILHLQDHGEPEPEPGTGRNAWTDSYLLLAHREEVREQEAMKALREGTVDDPRSPQLRSALAAYDAVHQPVNGGECAMDRCRREARKVIGSADATAKTGAAARVVATSFRSRQVTAATQRQALINEQLASHLEEVSQARGEFLHSLTSNEADPLAPPAPKVKPVDPVQEVLNKYGAGDDA